MYGIIYQNTCIYLNKHLKRNYVKRSLDDYGTYTCTDISSYYFFFSSAHGVTFNAFTNYSINIDMFDYRHRQTISSLSIIYILAFFPIVIILPAIH